MVNMVLVNDSYLLKTRYMEVQALSDSQLHHNLSTCYSWR